MALSTFMAPRRSVGSWVALNRIRAQCLGSAFWHHAPELGEKDYMRLVAACASVIFLAVLQSGITSATEPAGPSTTPPGLMGSMADLPPAEIERRLPNEAPSNFYGYAGRLWAAGEKDKAVFWMYAGQLRFRFLLLTEPNADPSGDPALFASLQETIGTPINAYAGADTGKWVTQINAVLKWDSDTPNGFTSKTKFSHQWTEARNGLVKLRDYIATHGDEIRKQRDQQGVGEVGLKDGVYVEERRAKMPADWPALESQSTLANVIGTYKASFDLGNALFSEDRNKVLRATTFEIVSDAPDSLAIVARRQGDELLRRRVTIRDDNGALVFDEVVPPDHMGLSTGTANVTVYLRANVAGDLVIQRELQGEGQRPNSKTPVRFLYAFWSRAARAQP